MKEGKVTENSVVQINGKINPVQLPYLGCFVLVTDVIETGIKGWIRMPLHIRDVPVKLCWGTFDYIGQATTIIINNKI